MVQKMGVAIMSVLRWTAVALILLTCAADAQRTGRIIITAHRAVATSDGMILTLVLTNDNSYRVRLALANHPTVATSTGHILSTMHVNGIYEAPTMVDAGNNLTVIAKFHHRPPGAFCNIDFAMAILVLQEHQIEERITLGLVSVTVTGGCPPAISAGQ